MSSSDNCWIGANFFSTEYKYYNYDNTDLDYEGEWIDGTPLTYFPSVIDYVYDYDDFDYVAEGFAILNFRFELEFHGSGSMSCTFCSLVSNSSK